MHDFNDEQLARRFQTAHEEAEQAVFELHKRHADHLLLFLRARLPSGADAEDVHQQVWVRVWQTLRSQFKGGNFKAWLYRIAHNCCTDAQRQSSRSRENVQASDVNPLDETWERMGPGEVSAEEEHSEQQLEALREAFEELAQVNGLMATLTRERMLGAPVPLLAQQYDLKKEEVSKLVHYGREFVRKWIVSATQPTSTGEAS